MASAVTAARRDRANESFQNAAECLGPVGKGASIFAITRGQWSMIDAILHTLWCCPGPCHISVWTWSIADYEVECLTRLMQDSRLLSARLVIDIGGLQQGGSRAKKADIGGAIVDQWHRTFGPDSVVHASNHAKIATIEEPVSGLKFCLRGSMNLNFNPRFEQFDLTEGGNDFFLVRQIEESLPVLPPTCTRAETMSACGIGQAWKQEDLAIFPSEPLKVWSK